MSAKCHLSPAIIALKLLICKFAEKHLSLSIAFFLSTKHIVFMSFLFLFICQLRTLYCDIYIIYISCAEL